MGFVNLLLAEITADYSVQDGKGAVFIRASTAVEDTEDSKTGN